MSCKTIINLFICLLSVPVFSGCVTGTQYTSSAATVSNTDVVLVPVDKSVYPGVWEDQSPERIHAFVSHTINQEGQASFTFIVTANGHVAGITKTQSLPVNADVSKLESLLKGGRFAPVFKHGKPELSYQSYTFYYGDASYLQYWRETCEHEGNRDNPSADSAVDVVHARYCTRVKYPNFLAYRFLLWPTRTACSSDPRHHCEIGRVMISFQLDGDGHTTDVAVYRADAGDLIELAARKAVENWYFVPTGAHKLDTKATYSITLIYQG